MIEAIRHFAFRKFKASEVKHHELNYLFWECTTRCNLNCMHCGSDCSKDSSYTDMPVNDFLAAVDTIIPIGRAVNHPELLLIDGSISACPNIDRSFVQGNIYTDNFYEVWQNRFQPFRNREWTRKGQCATCSAYNDCQGNGFHNWHGDKSNVLVCHLSKIHKGSSPPLINN